MAVKLTTKERIKLLHDNHKEHMASIMRNYGHQLHELLLLLEKENEK